MTAQALVSHCRSLGVLLEVSAEGKIRDPLRAIIRSLERDAQATEERSGGVSSPISDVDVSLLWTPGHDRRCVFFVGWRANTNVVAMRSVPGRGRHARHD